MKNKKILLGGLFLLLVVTIGYALLSETINISGTATASGEFNMEFSEVGPIVEAGSTGATAQISGDKNTLTITVPRLEYPGASVEIPVTIHNAGTIDAKLDSIDVNGLTEEDRSIVVTHSGLTENEELASGATKEMTIRVEWDPENNNPATDVQFTIGLNYSQAN